MLTKLMDISATVRLDSQESTVKLVSTPFNFECLRVNADKNRNRLSMAQVQILISLVFLPIDRS